MEQYIDFIQENPVIAIIGAAILLLLAGFILRKIKVLAVIFIIIAGLVFYLLIDANKVGNLDVDNIKDSVKEKVDVDKLKKSVKEKVMEKI